MRLNRRKFLTLGSRAVGALAAFPGLKLLVKTNPVPAKAAVKAKSSGAGQVWALNPRGGYLSLKSFSRQLQREFRPIVKFRAFSQIARRGRA